MPPRILSLHLCSVVLQVESLFRCEVAAHALLYGLHVKVLGHGRGVMVVYENIFFVGHWINEGLGCLQNMGNQDTGSQRTGNQTTGHQCTVSQA